VAAVVGYVVAAWVTDLDVANAILPGYVMGLFFFTGYPLLLRVCACMHPCRPALYTLGPPTLASMLPACPRHLSSCGVPQPQGLCMLLA
jgi:hypothetical protein